MSWLIDWIKSSIRNKLLLITGGGTTLLLAAALYGFWEAWRESLLLAPDVATEFQRHIMIALGATGVAILLAFVSFLWLVQRNIVGPAHQLAQDLNRLAQGDFSQPIRQMTQDEIGQVARSAEQIRNDLGQIVRNVMTATELVGQAATELAGTAASVVQSSEQQSRAASTAATSVEQVTSNTGAVASTAEEVRQLSHESMQESRTGSDQLDALLREMQSMNNTMEQISAAVGAFLQSTATITHMTQQVKDIADQTNLLALNAAIEAARAGEQGRGFAVVADEVRKLAEKSGQSANEIDAVTRSIHDQSAQVTASIELGQKFLGSSQALTQQAANALLRTRDAATRTNQGVDGIARLVVEQNVSSEEISRLVEQIASMAGDNTSAIQQAASAASRLVQLADGLEDAIRRFRI